MSLKKKISLKEKKPILLDEDTPFAIRESFNQFRTNLMYTFTESDGCPIFGITSVHEDSGKSTVITNLAYSFAQLGKKILLIDADMRCPALYRFFDLDPQQIGLSEVISGIQNDVILSDVKPNLDLILSGHIPPNPSELLISQKFKDLLHTWKQSYDIIFIDFPPVGLITDATTVCKELNGYIFNIASGRDSAKDVNACIHSMEQLGAKIVGVVLNDYNIKGSGSDYRSNYSGYHKHRLSVNQSRYEESYRNKTGKSRYEASYKQNSGKSRYEASYEQINNQEKASKK